MLNDGRIRGEERKARSAAWLAEAEAQQVRRRRPGEYVFRSVRMALLWYFERATTIGTARGMTIHTQQDYLGIPRRIVVDGGEQPDPDEVLTTLITVEMALALYAAGHPRRARAAQLVLGRHLTQEAAGRLLGASQQTVSRWVGECEGALLTTLREGGVVR